MVEVMLSDYDRVFNMSGSGGWRGNLALRGAKAVQHISPDGTTIPARVKHAPRVEVVVLFGRDGGGRRDGLAQQNR